MAYREVGMLEANEVLRRRLARMPKKQIARQFGLDSKTVRGFVQASKENGLRLVLGPAG